MRALVPESSWTVEGTENDGEELVGVTVATRESAGGVSRVRTTRRIGERMGPHGSVHGTRTDRIATAEYALSNLLLQQIPAGLPSDESRTQVTAALDRVADLARDHEGWHPTPLVIDGVSYALWVRRVPEGVAAHADLGWATVALWSMSQLTPGSFALVEVADPTDAV